MNYIPQIAKMLGVEIGEEFRLKGLPKSKVTPKYRFCEKHGLVSADDITGGCLRNMYLEGLLMGTIQIVKEPWKPNPRDTYFYIGKSNEPGFYVMSDNYMAFDEDIVRYRLGNCYPTKEAAEANLEKWKRFYLDDSPIDWEGQL